MTLVTYRSHIADADKSLTPSRHYRSGSSPLRDVLKRDFCCRKVLLGWVGSVAPRPGVEICAPNDGRVMPLLLIAHTSPMPINL